jgi:hypothetical protein
VVPLGALLLVWMLLAGLCSPEPQLAQAHPRREARAACHTHWRRGPDQVRRMIVCLAKRIRPPGGRRAAVDIARCEHGFGRDNVYQQLERYWAGRVRAHYSEHRARANARANVVVSMHMARADGTWRNHWATCSRRVGAP